MSHPLMDLLHRRLDGVAGPLVLGFSGGLDSTVLLHALVRAGFGPRVRALHVAHGLQAAARDWPKHCARECAALSVSYDTLDPGLDPDMDLAPGPNLEDRARQARREALLAATPEDGALLLAHHADDQAETLLLRLLRGAGPAGLAAMSADSRYAGRRLLRPLLEVTRVELADMAVDWGLRWVEDPTNTELTADRNFLRQAVIPLLQQRWPALVETLGRNARRQGEVAAMLDQLADADRAALLRPDGGLDLTGFAALPAVRQRNLLHGWLRAEGLQVPAERFLQRVLDELPGAAEDRMPEVAWPQAAFLRYRGALYLLPSAARVPVNGPHALQLEEGASVSLGPLTVRVTAVALPGEAAPHALYLPRHLDSVQIGPAPPGARLLQGGMHRDLRELWRAAGIPPWERRRLPVVLAASPDAPAPEAPVLLAAAGVGLTDGLSLAPGEPAWRLTWHHS